MLQLHVCGNLRFLYEEYIRRPISCSTDATVNQTKSYSNIESIQSNVGCSIYRYTRKWWSKRSCSFIFTVMWENQFLWSIFWLFLNSSFSGNYKTHSTLVIVVTRYSIQRLFTSKKANTILCCRYQLARPRRRLRHGAVASSTRTQRGKYALRFSLPTSVLEQANTTRRNTIVAT